MTINKLNTAGEEALYRALRRFWHPVAYADELGSTPLAVTLLDEPLVIVRLGADVAAFRDLCVHRGTALSLGWVEDSHLVCAYHGWTYDAAGMCIRIPSRHGTNIPRRARLIRYLAAEAAGLIWVCLADEPALPIPEYVDWPQPGFRLVKIPAYEWASSAARRIENFVDISHFAWVHEGLLASRDDPFVPDQDVARDEVSLAFTVALKEPGSALKGVSDESFQGSTEYRLFMPFSALLRQTLPGGRVFSLFIAASPTSAKRTRPFTWNARNYDPDPGRDTSFVEFQELILSQDKPVVESQRPEELPVDLTAELHIRGVDRIALDYRRWLIEIATMSLSDPEPTDRAGAGVRDP